MIADWDGAGQGRAGEVDIEVLESTDIHDDIPSEHTCVLR